MRLGARAQAAWPTAHGPRRQNVRHTGLAPSSPIIFNEPVSQVVRLGAASLLSTIPVGAAPMNFQWTLKRVPLLDATNSALLLTNLQPAMLGDYRLVITNQFGAVTSQVAMLSVSIPPAITVPPQNQTVVVGSTVIFSVAAIGSPPLSYQWQFNGTNLADATASELSLTNVSSKDAGPYQAVITNEMGSAVSSAATLW